MSSRGTRRILWREQSPSWPRRSGHSDGNRWGDPRPAWSQLPGWPLTPGPWTWLTVAQREALWFCVAVRLLGGLGLGLGACVGGVRGEQTAWPSFLCSAKAGGAKAGGQVGELQLGTPRLWWTPLLYPALVFTSGERKYTRLPTREVQRAARPAGLTQGVHVPGGTSARMVR